MTAINLLFGFFLLVGFVLTFAMIFGKKAANESKK